MGMQGGRVVLTPTGGWLSMPPSFEIDDILGAVTHCTPKQREATPPQTLPAVTPHTHVRHTPSCQEGGEMLGV